MGGTNDRNPAACWLYPRRCTPADDELFLDHKGCTTLHSFYVIRRALACGAPVVAAAKDMGQRVSKHERDESAEGPPSDTITSGVPSDVWQQIIAAQDDVSAVLSAGQASSWLDDHASAAITTLYAKDGHITAKAFKRFRNANHLVAKKRVTSPVSGKAKATQQQQVQDAIPLLATSLRNIRGHARLKKLTIGDVGQKKSAGSALWQLNLATAIISGQEDTLQELSCEWPLSGEAIQMLQAGCGNMQHMSVCLQGLSYDAEDRTLGRVEHAHKQLDLREAHNHAQCPTFTSRLGLLLQPKPAAAAVTVTVPPRHFGFINALPLLLLLPTDGSSSSNSNTAQQGAADSTIKQYLSAWKAGKLQPSQLLPALQPALTDITLKGMHFVLLPALGKGSLPALQHLELEFAAGSGAAQVDLRVLANADKLRSLVIRNAHHVLGYATLQGLPSLQHMELQPAVQESSLDATGLSSIMQLRSLVLKCWQLHSITALQQLTQLTSLVLVTAQRPHGRLNADRILPLCHLASLKHLVLVVYEPIDVSPLAAQLVQLQHLELDCWEVHNLESLAALQQLSSLVVKNNPYGDARSLWESGAERLLQALAHLPELRLLDLPLLEVKSAGAWSAIAAMQQLRDLRVGCITGRAAPESQQLPESSSITSVHLYNTAVVNVVKAAAGCLARLLPNLQQLTGCFAGGLVDAIWLAAGSQKLRVIRADHHSERKSEPASLPLSQLEWGGMRLPALQEVRCEDKVILQQPRRLLEYLSGCTQLKVLQLELVRQDGRREVAVDCSLKVLRQLQRKLLLKRQEENAQWQKERRRQARRERMLKTLPIGAAFLIAAAGLVKHARKK